MKLVKPPRFKLFSFLFSMPLIDVILNLIMFGERLWQDPKVWVVSFPLIFLLGYLSWYSHLLYETAVEKKYPALSQSRQRITMKVLIVFLVMMPSVLIIFFIYHAFHILGYQIHSDHLYKGMIVGACVNIIFETLFEAEYIFTKYKESTFERDTLEQLTIQQEFDTLKNQVNPHFLFNCFNTLSSLISVDKGKAEIFLDELSKVYRYLLRNNQETTGSLETEIKFIRSYYKLLQTRHGEAVQLNIQIDKRYNNYQLPSLSLQLLVENVVKHNALSKNKPLVIDIFTTAGNKLVVTNNLQRRTQKAPSNGVGLDNIRAKYLLLRQPGFQVLEDEKNFTVVLPLIWKSSDAIIV